MQPLDLSCPTKRPHSPDLSPSSSLSDIRRLSHGSDDLRSTGGSGEESEEEQKEFSAIEVEEGPARKRFLSKFFRDPKGNCDEEESIHLLKVVASWTLDWG